MERRRRMGGREGGRMGGREGGRAYLRATAGVSEVGGEVRKRVRLNDEGDGHLALELLQDLREGGRVRRATGSI